MTTGGGTRKQPLIIAITTAGVPSQAPVWWDEHEYARRVREGVLIDPTLYSVFYGASPDDDFEDPKVWRKANPGLGLFMSEKAFKADLIAAKQRGGTAWNEFLLYRLNVPTAQKDRWLPMQHWESAREQYTADDMRGQWCYGGLDLSTRRDITALSWIFPKEDGSFRTLWRFWLPENNVPDHLRGWVRDGYIQTTPGETVDYEFIRAQIAEDSKRFEVRAISYDSWNAQHLANELIGDGHNMVEVRFGLRSMSLPSKEFEAAFVDGRFRHDGNPVARWMADSISTRADASGNIIPVKPDRLKDSNRIDGIVATIMAYDSVVRNPIEGSVYSGERGILFV
jgi:phage terminase large subunit-like protein